MKILNIYHSKSALVYTLVFIKRHLITFRKFRQLYTEFWFPSPSSPPYSHICQIGDPVLRYKAEQLNVEDIKKHEIQGVRRRISALTLNFGFIYIVMCGRIEICPQALHSVISCQKYKPKMCALNFWDTLDRRMGDIPLSSAVTTMRGTQCSVGVRCDLMIWNTHDEHCGMLLTLGICNITVVPYCCTGIRAMLSWSASSRR
jgi:hypothetical protein